jgi:ADP-ribose pyrophosphatase YjhB (NUDIX family)
LGTSALHSVSVAAIITNDAGQVLMIQRRDNGHWEPPGGVLELDEAIEDGLQREVHEETGLDVEPERLTGVYKNMPRSIVALVFRSRIVGGSITTGPEVAHVEWLTQADIAESSDEAYAIRVADALRDGPAAVRSHDGVRLLSAEG